MEHVFPQEPGLGNTEINNIRKKPEIKSAMTKKIGASLKCFI